MRKGLIVKMNFELSLTRTLGQINVTSGLIGVPNLAIRMETNAILEKGCFVHDLIITYIKKYHTSNEVSTL